MFWAGLAIIAVLLLVVITAQLIHIKLAVGALSNIHLQNDQRIYTALGSLAQRLDALDGGAPVVEPQKAPR